MAFLDGDTYFNRWPVKLLNVADLAVMEELQYDKLYESVT